MGVNGKSGSAWRVEDWLTWIKETMRYELKEIIEVLKSIARTNQTTRFHYVVQLTVLDTPTQLPSFKCERGVVLKGENANAAVILAATRDSVAVTGDGAIGGFEIGAGQAVTVPVRELRDLWAITAVTGQVLHIWAS